jgi:CDP-glucose 4,6-dehydratase
LAKNWPNARWEIDKASHPHEANYLKLDISKVYAKLGWAPKVRLNKAIDFIIEWSNAHDQGGDMRSFSLQQLSEYENLLKN